MADLDHNLIHGSLDPRESAPIRHLSRFSRVCGAHERHHQTDWQTTLLSLQQ